ncbi:quinoprotein relay system zinc metallohydrolase 1 [Calidithermus terrae]|uniref:Quinoprotein relay system zinc metallohydrolase 1 n=1 Tax=Calidithermus terrae TaxID=1408545 RepID=A0A399F151_9DEIN|nr:MBL fold metallo-hydrolase [Calidithermus terrae]RIH88522.1 quinoprotein relay system zinc metallohydrolase 1 [Calidithermus terrae]
MIHTLDLLDRAPRVIASFLLETPEGPAVFETGPESRFETLARALREKGYAPQDVRHVFVTHIHLDHAGAAWRFAEHGATVYVHPKGAPHLTDPSKLWASAARIYGDQMEALWGRMGYVPEAQVRVLQDRQTVSLGGFTVEALDTPGHANHHHAYRIGAALIAGDVAGVRIGRGPVLPPCPPPDIHVETWQQSLARLRGLGLEALYLTHFGPVTDVQAHLAALEARLLDWADWMRRRLKTGRTRDEIVPEFEAHVADELHAAGLSNEEVREYEYADPAWMSVDGLMRYWTKHRPEAVAPAS